MRGLTSPARPSSACMRGRPRLASTTPSESPAIASRPAIASPSRFPLLAQLPAARGHPPGHRLRGSPTSSSSTSRPAWSCIRPRARQRTPLSTRSWRSTSTWTCRSTQRPGIVHRLDKETSGLMVVAKNDRAQRALQRADAAPRDEEGVRGAGPGPPAPSQRDHRCPHRARPSGASKRMAMIASGRASSHSLPGAGVR